MEAVLPLQYELRFISVFKKWKNGVPSTTGRGFSPSTSVFPCLWLSTNAQYSSPSTRCCYKKDEWAKPGNRPKSNAPWKTRKIG